MAHSKKDWFSSVKVVSRTKLLQTFAKKRDKGAPLPKLRGARIIDMGAWKYPRVGVRIVYIDRVETFYTTRDIERIFDIDKSTVYKWIKMGLLPPPIMQRENQYGRFTRYYVRPQLAVAARVVNDLRRQGLMRFTKAKIKHHLAMIEEGNKQALEEWHARRRNPVIRDRSKTGVTWLADDPE